MYIYIYRHGLIWSLAVCISYPRPEVHNRLFLGQQLEWSLRHLRSRRWASREASWAKDHPPMVQPTKGLSESQPISLFSFIFIALWRPPISKSCRSKCFKPDLPLQAQLGWIRVWLSKVNIPSFLVTVLVALHFTIGPFWTEGNSPGPSKLQLPDFYPWK